MPKNSSPVPGGILLLSDLELRADAALKRHTDTYTATSVLSRLVTHMIVSGGGGLDEVREALETVRAAVEEYRRSTHQVWRAAFMRWADAAGLDVDLDALIDSPDTPGIPGSESEGR
ncbi:conserved hypothetical protein [Frankia sp. AiPs1]|uniref:hypothetical protein n=1 Tax=Frankia sp. AiPa1 TaxID=573492 RepID=UPI00202B6A4E|nr:hypothetical protein [Frankia sp. AiPa1]MCL9758791.1 hypothetical protein [Frankia sp. AiPa1]